MMTDTIKKQRDEFERMLKNACREHLKSDIDAEHYAECTLDEMHTSDDEPYSLPAASDWHCEIPARHTKDGLPRVVSL